MKKLELNELTAFVTLLQERIGHNLKLIETYLMEIIQYYMDSENQNVIKQLDGVNKKLFKLKDDVHTYRIPPLLLKPSTDDFINQSIVVIFYFELMLIESKTIIDEFQATTKNINVVPVIIDTINNFSEFYSKVKNLMNQLESFDKLGRYDEVKIYNVIWNNVKNLYQNSDKIKRVLKSCKQLNLMDIESTNVSNIHEKNSSITHKVFKIGSMRDQLLDIVLKIGDSSMIEELGGFISMAKLLHVIKTDNPTLEIDLNDLGKVLQSLKKKGLISNILDVKNLKIIQFKSLELSQDPIKLLEVIDVEGIDTKDNIMRKLRWTESRVENVLNFLIEKGVCKPGEKSFIGTKYYFPGLQK